MTTTISKIEVNEQILFSLSQAIFVGIITEEREKAVKVDYCWESVWGNGVITVYTYTTWIPKAVIINDEIGGLTVKKWFTTKGLNSEKVYHIKKYFIKNGNKVFV